MWQVMEVDVDMRTCQVTEGLTEDAVSARLHQGGLVPPLYLHSSIHSRQDGRLSESSVEAEWEQRVSQLFRSQVQHVHILLASHEPIQHQSRDTDASHGMMQS